jgi:outer membrane protein, heavy metal efflux system
MKDFRVFHTTLMLAAILAGTPLVTSPSLAGEEKRLDLASLIAELTERNPEMKAARERWEAAKAVVPQVQTLPDPTLQVGYQSMAMLPPAVQGPVYGGRAGDPFSWEAPAARRSGRPRGGPD